MIPINVHSREPYHVVGAQMLIYTCVALGCQLKHEFYFSFLYVSGIRFTSLRHSSKTSAFYCDPIGNY